MGGNRTVITGHLYDKETAAQRNMMKIVENGRLNASEAPQLPMRLTPSSRDDSAIPETMLTI